MDLTLRMTGRTIQAVYANGYTLSIRCADGSEINVVWVKDGGEIVKGQPMLLNSGARLVSRDVNELFQPPHGDIDHPIGVQ
jgi:hypothetical protein